MTPQLLQAALGCSQEQAARFAEPLRAACALYGIDTPRRLAAFLAQVGHESGSLRFTSEVWGPTSVQSRYEGRADLGNVQPGDGRKFSGHGLIQITGRYNHARVRDRLRQRFPDVPDFEADPERLTEPQWAALSAADYWDDRGLNLLADTGNFEGITRRINGGLNGQADRLARWERIKRVLAQPEPDTTPTKTPKEPAMAFPLLPLAGLLIDIFSPLAKEKITKEMARHTDNPEVQQKIAQDVVTMAQTLTGKPDPVEAVVAAKADPAIVQQIEDDALERLAKMAPILDKIAAWDQQAWDAEEASRNAASQRAAAEGNDMAPALANRAFWVYMTVFLSTLTMIGVQMYVTADHKPAGELVGFFIAVATMGAKQWERLFEYRFGSSRSSGAKDAVIGELSRRGKQ